jgi:transposase-like protein
MKRTYQRTPKEKRDEIVSVFLSGDNSAEELAEYYNVNPHTIRTWVKRYRYSKKVVSLQADTKPLEDMARKKKEEKSPEVLALEARVRELELQNLALNTLIDVAERNGIDIRKKSGAKQ